MNVQALLLSQFKKSLPSLGAEEIIIGSSRIMAIIDETQSSNALARAATNNERSVTAKFAADAATPPLKSGVRVTARAQEWQISADSGAIKKGRVSITIDLVEPERRDE